LRTHSKFRLKIRELRRLVRRDEREEEVVASRHVAGEPEGVVAGGVGLKRPLLWCLEICQEPFAHLADVH
jgi:hypothetical protein